MNREFQTGQTDRRMSFKVPEGFFEELPRRTVERLRIETRRRRRKLWMRTATVVIPFAACLAVVVLFRFPSHRGIEPTEMPQTGTEQFALYLQGLSDEELANLAAETSLDPTCCY